MLLVFGALASNPQLYAWSPEPGRLVVALTDTASLRGEWVISAGERSFYCILSEVLHCRLDGGSGSWWSPRGEPLEGSVRLFWGLRSDPAPVRGRRPFRRGRHPERPDPPGPVRRLPADALVVELPVEPGPTTVEARAVERRWAPGVPHLGVEGAGCDGRTLLTLEVDPWVDVGAVVLEVDGQRSEVVLPGRVVVESGRPVTVEMPDGQRCTHVVGGGARVLACGGDRVAIHERPACALRPRETVLRRVGRPSLPVDPERLDRLDRRVDGVEEALFVAAPLRVDTSRSCTPEASTFLEHERAEARGVAPRTCGGRTPGGQAYDVLLTHAINGPDRLPRGAPYHGTSPGAEAPLRTDGVQPPRALAGFPYLPEPP